MKLIIAATLVITLLPCIALAQGTTSQSDQEAIEQVIQNWNKAWRTKDVKLAAQDYFRSRTRYQTNESPACAAEIRETLADH